ncbi:glyoxylate/hydroxypyruvate reductase A [Alphaproteobacteria bacterium KMM 3653]|uniref:Glyoxylate/hydroxypyruvate reductase A n=1 Tax=Harenicola maris TaxID=2841044 RepID=A0AAP2CPX1_9RHOB|nr:glyoxylate/hydroxypyruvate reductase A [Harenicola maris]
MKAVIYTPNAANTDAWVGRMRALLPDWSINALLEETDPDAVQYAVVWKPQTGAMAQMKNLKAVVSIGAGIDHVLADPELPKHLPIIRTVGEDLTQFMREYVALHVLRHHRDRPQQAAAEARAEWSTVEVPPATRRKVGIMGLGNLGAAAAKTLAGLGFQTLGWTRTRREIDGVTCYAGAGEFDEFLAQSEILVNLLPLTDHTAGILSADLFAKLPKGACLINAARGQHLIEDDLLAALESGQIAQATLDVFTVEPLPEEHPFWAHPAITVTPHIASRIDAETGSRIIAANLAEYERSGAVADLADAKRGY